MHTSVLRRLATTAAVAALVLSAAPAHAQSGGSGSTPGDGDWSVGFTLFEPDQGTTFGIFRMFGSRVKLGLNVTANTLEIDRQIEVQQTMAEEQQESWAVAVGPSIQWFGSRKGPVSPFLRGAVAVGQSHAKVIQNGLTEQEQEGWTLVAEAAIGAEWYPLRWLGVSGHTGVRWVRDEIDFTNRSPEALVEETISQLNTFRSGLAVHFYFR